MTDRPKPVVLCILDGWGHREELEQNAIAQAQTPNWNRLVAEYPNGLINASELHVGLPEGQMGNSEVGHMNIGSGRVLMQELPKIDAAIVSGALAKHSELQQFITKIKATTGVVHLLGLLSPGGVHSHQAHIAALGNILASAGLQVKIHAFLDGRDTPPKSALDYLKALPLEGGGSISIATLSGRYYAMDRDKRWDRVEKAYNNLIDTSGQHSTNAKTAIEASYAADKTDEFLLPITLGDYNGMQDGDGLLMANFRADRVREILTSLLDPAFDGFTRKRIVQFGATLGLTEYSKALKPFIPALFPPEPLTNILGEVVANAGLKQLRIAETEKYAHVTFFFNGGREQEFAGEERILVPSPKVATYDLKPEMSAPEITDKLVTAIAQDKFDFIVVNYANTDMVGHSGNLEAAKKAVEAVDQCVGRLYDAVKAKHGAMLITADHGNAEQMFDDHTHQAHTAHTLNLVPAVLISDALKGKKLSIREGKLGDVAPTMLQWLGLKQPAEMTGQSLLDEAPH